MKFQINTCPLCNEACQLRKVAGVTFFSCPTQSLDLQQSHYEVEINSKTEFQRIIIYPYAIDSTSIDSKSRVYHLEYIDSNQYNLKFIMMVPLIHADLESRLLERLDKLIIFL